MSSLNKKAWSPTLSTLIGMVLLAIVVVSFFGLFNQARAEVEDMEHSRCKWSIEVAQGLSLDYKKLGIQTSIQPVSIECVPILVDEEEVFNKKKEGNVAGEIIEMMRTTWWASGAGKFNNVWEDVKSGDHVCKAFYYFRTKETFDEFKNKELDRDKFIDIYMENRPLEDVEWSLAEYVAGSKGDNNRIFVLVDEFKDGVTYGIYMMSSSKSDDANAIVVAEIKDDDGKTMEEMKRQVKVYYNLDNYDVCTNIPDKDEDFIRVIF